MSERWIRLRGTRRLLVTMGTAVGLCVFLAPVASADATRHVDFETSISQGSLPSFLYELTRPGKDLRWGTVVLSGPTTFETASCTVTVAVTVEYLDDDGPYSGFMTVDCPGGNTLSMAYDGRADRRSDGSSTLRGHLRVIGGAGTYEHTTGNGWADGTRAGVVGAPVDYDLHLDLKSGADPRAPRSNPVPASPRHPNLRISSTMSGDPDDQNFITLPSQRAYGNGRYTGTGVLRGRNVDIETLFVSDYVQGSGPWHGFITLRTANGSTLVLRGAGNTRRLDNGSSKVRGGLAVIGGTGRWAHSWGWGTYRATRTGAIGGDIAVKLSLRLYKR